MNSIMFNKLRNEKADKRYIFFIKTIVDNEKAYSLYNAGWALYSDGVQTLFPLWSNKEFALDCKKDEFANFNVEEIDLYDLLDELIIKLDKDKVGITVFPTFKESGIVVPIKQLIEDINCELEKYS